MINHANDDNLRKHWDTLKGGVALQELLDTQNEKGKYQPLRAIAELFLHTFFAEILAMSSHSPRVKELSATTAIDLTDGIRLKQL